MKVGETYFWPGNLGNEPLLFVVVGNEEKWPGTDRLGYLILLLDGAYPQRPHDTVATPGSTMALGWNSTIAGQSVRFPAEE